jgi:dephospho-CoA kinase
MPQPRSKPVIGLLGGIGSGKSLVAEQLAQMGCAVIDADALARDALQSDDVRRTLAQWWGPGVLDGTGAADDTGAVDRAAVAKIVFDDPDALRRLEGLIHPRVHAQRSRLRQRYQDDPAVVAIVEDCPLLAETGLDAECDVLIFVRASRAVRLGRVAEHRGWSDRELAAREKRQMPLDKKAALADYFIDNDAGPDQCLAQTRRVLSQIIQQDTSASAC